MTDPSSIDPEVTERPLFARLMMSALLVFFFGVFVSLGVWQIERLFWKRDLIARVDARVHAAAVAAPPRAEWPAIAAASQEYLHVRLTGTYVYGKDVLVQASTELGPGYWVMTPLRQEDGTTVLVNRGFVPTDRRTPADRKSSEVKGPVTVTGLLRMTEPKGSLLRSNDPAEGRWYSRDVEAILSKDGEANGAPYFVDADATLNPGGLPVGGLTIIRFPNNHLVYLITWFGLALMVAGALVYLWRPVRRAQ